MLNTLHVVLVRPRFAENVGAAARACLNMGASHLTLVDPENYDPLRALPLATAHAKHILDQTRIVPDLATALAETTHACGTTARLGGWRTTVTTPERAAPEIAAKLALGLHVALVFGPEDKGLSNAETSLCHTLLHIPTHAEGTSLNLAQAVMVCLYETAKAARHTPRTPGKDQPSRPISHAERELLHEHIKQALAAIHVLKDQNTDYWMLPVRRLTAKAELTRRDFNLLMGICRQMLWLAGQRE